MMVEPTPNGGGRVAVGVSAGAGVGVTTGVSLALLVGEGKAVGVDGLEKVPQALTNDTIITPSIRLV
jgi:hypothetical protein